MCQADPEEDEKVRRAQEDSPHSNYRRMSCRYEGPRELLSVQRLSALLYYQSKTMRMSRFSRLRSQDSSRALVFISLPEGRKSNCQIKKVCDERTNIQKILFD